MTVWETFDDAELKRECARQKLADCEGQSRQYMVEQLLLRDRVIAWDNDNSTFVDYYYCYYYYYYHVFYNYYSYYYYYY